MSNDVRNGKKADRENVQPSHKTLFSKVAQHNRVTDRSRAVFHHMYFEAFHLLTF